jgi:hypothetical protein
LTPLAGRLQDARTMRDDASEDEFWEKMSRSPEDPARAFSDGGDEDEDEVILGDEGLEDEGLKDEGLEDEDAEDGADELKYLHDKDLPDAWELEQLQIGGELHRPLKKAVERIAGRERAERSAVPPVPPVPPVPMSPEEASRAWLSSPRMTRTEVGLRFARYVLAERYVASDVTIALTGVEMVTKAKRPVFPVAAFLAAHGYAKADEASDDWRDSYVKEGVEFAITLREKPDEAPMLAELPSGARLLVDVMGGPLDPTRSSTEHTQLRTAIGRAITLFEVRQKDVLVVAMPRSRRFRHLARLWRDAPRVIEARLRLVVVDRAGNVDGLRGLRARKT